MRATLIAGCLVKILKNERREEPKSPLTPALSQREREYSKSPAVMPLV